MQLSRFFMLDELTRSGTAQQLGIANAPGAPETENLKALCRAVLDPLRESIGMPLKVNSGYRSPALNQRIGGAATSQHVSGMAADIQAAGMPVIELFKRIISLDLPYDQVIYEAKDARTKWVHVSHNPARTRGEIRIAKFDAAGRPVGYPSATRKQALAMQEPVMRGLEPEALGYVEMDDAPAAPPKRARPRATGKGAAAQAKPKPRTKPPTRKPSPERKAGAPPSRATAVKASARTAPQRKTGTRRAAAPARVAAKKTRKRAAARR